MAVYSAQQLETDLKLRFKLNSTDRDGLLKNWMNDAQQRIWKEHDWSFYYKTLRLNTIIEISTGTVAISNGSTTVTGTGTTFLATHVGALIFFEDSPAFYTVKTYSSATSIELETAFQDTTISGKTFNLRQPRIAVPSDFGHTKALTLDSRNDFGLHNITMHEWFTHTSGTNYSGEPSSYVVMDYNGSTYLHLHPIPVSAEALNIFYKRIPTEISTVSSDNLDMPSDYQFNELVRYAVIEMYHTYEGDLQQAQWARSNYFRFLKLCKNDDRKDDQMPQKRPIQLGMGSTLTRIWDSDWVQ